MGEQIDFVGDGTSKIIERFTDIRGIIVGFIRILRAWFYQYWAPGSLVGTVRSVRYLKKFLVYLL